jgi:HNH endonuclease
MTPAGRRAVRERAGGRCEYCRLPDFAIGSEDFHVEHIVARKHGARNVRENLAWACIFCNLYKGPNLASLDPDTGRLTRLFHPRRDQWGKHFALEGARLRGLTAIGRTTIWLLDMNSDVQVNLRGSLMREERWL